MSGVGLGAGTPCCVLHWSDPHFGTEQPPVVQALLQLAHDADPSLLVLSGDITQRARRGQFRLARAFVDRLPRRPLLVVPGNHDLPLFDLPRRLFSPYGNHRATFGESLEPVHADAAVLAIGVDTTRRWRHKNGEVSPAQSAAVAARLAQGLPGQLRLVVAHHPVQVTRPVDRPNLLRGRAHAVPAWAAAGVDLVLGGHIHLPYVRALSQEYADVPSGCWAVQAGTALSHRVRAEAANSVNLIRYQPAAQQRECMVERWDFDAGARAFRCRERTPLALRDQA